ncbi:MAG: NAD-dependent epimerase/dehydratase family protein [Myxococcota bacterium]
MKIFLTGGHGFIGSHVVERLAKRGNTLRCLVRKSSKTHRIDAFPFDRVVGDVRDTASMQAGMQECDAVIHLASVSSWEDMESSALEDIVIQGTKNVAQAAKAAGVKRLVYVSSSMAVNASAQPKVHDESSPFELTDAKYRYPRAKNAAEEALSAEINEDFEVVTVCPCEVYGPNDDALVTASNLRDMINDWPALACTGGTAVVHVDDVADGIVAALDKGRSAERYILGGENLTVEELVRLTLDIAGLKTPVLKLPNGLVKAVVGSMAKVGLPTPVVPEVLTYATLFWFMDSGKATRELGFRARPSREVLLPTIRWLYEAGHAKKGTKPELEPARAS